MTQQDVYLGGAARLGALTLLSKGKVRDIYTVDEGHLCFITTDRISAFDVVMDIGIPNKGRVLTAIAAHWFARTGDVIANHLVSTSADDLPGLSAEEREALRGRIMLVNRCAPTSVEWVVRGYIAGSGWKEYQKQGTVCGIPLPSGLGFCQRLPEPILTPTTKDDVHDLPLTPDEARERVGGAVFDQLQKASLDLFARGTEELAKIGILLADTKFEFGVLNDELVLIDEALTPDSSRFWPAAEYEVGKNPPSFDKQILRDHLETLDWDKNPPPPALGLDVVDRIAGRYLEICAMITGASPAEVTA